MQPTALPLAGSSRSLLTFLGLLGGFCPFLVFNFLQLLFSISLSPEVASGGSWQHISPSVFKLPFRCSQSIKVAVILSNNLH